ncbi:hypothetical protein [uncultured Rikenella sp.]|uniref:hypothetical protein n=1 Tax=uncultured Rikenella sp. TaxID=368003 RepID=UPI00272B13A6|nr:hypothetical protein [uncultured Rikenella sp.]
MPFPPAPGFRDAGSNGRLGDLMGIGNDGFSYSSSVEDSNRVCLYFYTQRLDASYLGYRAYGLQLRCLSE